MSIYMALKPCRFGGDNYLYGNIIPDGKVLAGKAEALCKMGLIAPAIRDVSMPVSAKSETVEPEEKSVESEPITQVKKTRMKKAKSE